MSLIDQLSRGVDNLVGIVFPEKAARRMGVRASAELAYRAWDSAKSSRTWQNRTVSDGSADADLDEDTLGILRSRSRDRWRNDALAHACISSLTDNVVGTGLVPRLRVPWKLLDITRERGREIAMQANEVLRTWSRTCDATNRLHFAQMQHLAVSSALISGDVFALPLMVEDAKVPSRYRLKVELVEGDRIDSPWGYDRKKANIRNGVELGARGQPIAYWVHIEHPGDIGAFARAGKRKMRRVKAHNAAGRPNVLHVYDQERPGQSRGKPILAPVLDLFKNLDDYEEAELVAAQVGACFAAFVTQTHPDGGAFEMPTETGQGDDPIDELAPGMFQYLGFGQDIKFANPTRPNTAFEAFVKAVSRRITAAVGQPYEIATRDFSGTTYSQARAAALEARRMFQRRQRWLVHGFLDPIWRMLLEEAWLAGDLDVGDDFLERIDLWTRTLWVPAGWGWVDPAKEVQAWEKALAMGVTTRSKIIAASDGGDFDDVTQDLADELATRRELGLESGAAPADDEAEEKQESADDEPPDDDESNDEDSEDD